MEQQEDHQRLLEQALTQIELPIGIVLRTWHEDDFPAIQRLSSAEGWPRPEKRPEEALVAWNLHSFAFSLVLFWFIVESEL